MNKPLAVDGNRFVRETIDGETIIMDTVSGRLLLLRQTAPLLLATLTAGFPPEALLAEILSRYGSEAQMQTRSFVAMLTELGVFATQDATGTSPSHKAPDGLGWPSSFAPPIVEVYDDIADIITLDPIHDVDADTGWPRAAATSRE
jgi:hypothetical protein